VPSAKRQGGSGDRAHESLRGLRGEEAGAADREHLRGVRASWETPSPAGTPPSGARSQADVDGKHGEPHDRQRAAIVPAPSGRRKPSRWWETTGAERDPGGWHRRAEGNLFRQGTGSGRPPRRTDGGDLEEETRRSRRMKPTLGMHSCIAERASRLQRAGRAGSAKDSGGRPGVRARAGRDDAGEGHQRWWSNAAEACRAAFGRRRRAHGKTSNTRPATVKVKEGGGKGQRPATAHAGGIYSGFIRAPRHLKTTS